VLVDQPSAALLVFAGLPWPGLDQYFDQCGGRYAKQAKAKKAPELAHSRITQAFASSWTHGKPNLITRGHAIYGLQHKIKTEGKF
jgi:hypothetical protein